LDEQALYLAIEASPEVGHRFLLAAHETFLLLAKNPQMGWHARLKATELAGLRVFRVTGFERILVLIVLTTVELRSCVCCMTRETSKHYWAVKE
jgi:hypothetical protein